MAVKGDWAIKRAKKRSTNDLIDRESRLRRSFLSRRGLSMDATVELAAIRLVLAERQVKLDPVEGLPELL